MSKYQALGTFLRALRADEVFLSFHDIERITDARLPLSAVKRRSWWSNNANNRITNRIWLDAGFEVEQVDMVRRKLVFGALLPGRQVRPGASILCLAPCAALCA